MGKNNKRLTTEEFIRRAKVIHGEKYIYDKTVYVNQKTIVTITCRKHGDFSQIAGNHINPLQKNGCPYCAREHQNDGTRKTTEQFIKESKEYYGENRFDYSKTIYVNAKTPVILICHEKDKDGIEHGEFPVNPHNHLSAHNHNGCPICGEHLPSNTKTFIQMANRVHNGKYTYENTVYINAHEKVIITCPKHGDFPQQADSHLRGCGCPVCNESHLERDVRTMLDENSIRFIYHHHEPWLGKLELDFYLPDYNIAIECQGRQHYISIDFFGGDEQLIKQQMYDEQKRTLCIENGIKLVYYTLPELKEKDEFIEVNELFNFIKSNELRRNN